jgi:hypothetical protein
MPAEPTARLVRHPTNGDTYVLIALADTTSLLLTVEEATMLRDVLIEVLA